MAMKAQNYQTAIVLLLLGALALVGISAITVLFTGSWWYVIATLIMMSPVVPVMAWGTWRDRVELRRQWRVRRRRRELLAGEFRRD